MAEDDRSSFHPLDPPSTEDARLDWLRLLRSPRVGPATFHRLMADHGSARAALAALPEIARAAGVADYAPCPERVVVAEWRAGRALRARLICRGEAAWPGALNDIPDPPPMLWCLGDPSVAQAPLVALVGARNASSLGLRMARLLAEGLGRAGLGIVSGLARGIDGAAHEASLATGTVAVLAGGLDKIYPPEHRDLARRIAGGGGCLFSEAPMGMVARARDFPKRNRLVSGLSMAVVVVEAAARSGSLITARAALDQGREVMAVPGHPMDARGQGCNHLIRDGARLVQNADDILETLPQPAAPRRREPMPAPACAEAASPATQTPLEAGALSERLLRALTGAPVAEEAVLMDLGAPQAVVLAALTELEMAGRIQRDPGGLLRRVA